MPSTTDTNICNFFALLKDNTVKKINLFQTITSDIRNVFLDGAIKLLNDDMDEILFDGNFSVQENEILYVEMEIPQNIKESIENPIGTENLILERDDVKAIFWVENDIYYFQNFDRRKILNNKNILFYSSNTYKKLTNDALIVEDYVNAIYQDGKLFFHSYHNAHKIFSLSAFYEEASNEVIEEFVQSEYLLADVTWLKEQSNNTIRKQITLIQKSNVLQNADTKKIKKEAKKFNLEIILIDGKLSIPSDKKLCKNILSFLNEQYYIGLISGKKFRTNSKREA